MNMFTLEAMGKELGTASQSSRGLLPAVRA